MKNLLIKNVKGPRVALLFILTNVLYAFMLLKTIPQVMGFSGGMKLLDMLPAGYDFAYVSDLFEKLGDAGRNAYLLRQIPADMVYPALFAISYSLLLAFFIKKLNNLNGPLVYACLLPIIAGLFDYMENIGIISMLVTYPNLSTGTVTATNIFTVIKSITTSIYFVLLLVVMVMVGIKFIRSKRITPKTPNNP